MIGLNPEQPSPDRSKLIPPPTTSTLGVAPQRPTRATPPNPMFVQYDPLLYQVQYVEGGGVGVYSKRPAQLVTVPRPVDELAKLPFGQSVLGWDRPIPSDGDLTKIDVTASQPVVKNSDDLMV